MKKNMAKTEKKIVQKMFKGVVTSAAMTKTIVAKVDTMKEHFKYHKSQRVSKKFHVHDELGTAKVGDVVEFIECRPMSLTKRWNLVKVVKAAK